VKEISMKKGKTTVALLALCGIAVACFQISAFGYDGDPSMIVYPIDANLRKEIIKNFIANNPGLDWKTETVVPDSYSGFIEQAKTTEGSFLAHRPSPSEEEAKSLARDFVALNKKFFDISDEELTKLHIFYSPGAESIDSELSVYVPPKKRPPSYENAEDLVFDVSIRLWAAEGKIYQVGGRQATPLKSYKTLDLKSAVSATDPKIQNQMLGKEIFHLGPDQFGGISPISDGNIELADIQSADVSLNVVAKPFLGAKKQALPASSYPLFVGLAWKITVTRHEGKLTFAFDAHNGELVDSY
jgi:hypothetical protein